MACAALTYAATCAPSSLNSSRRLPALRTSLQSGPRRQRVTGCRGHAQDAALVARTCQPLPAPNPRTERGVPARTPREWLKASVHEIISHLPEAPVLHLVFGGERKDGGIVTASRRRISTSTSSPDHWDAISKGVLETDPDALILVRRLQDPGHSLDQTLRRETEGPSSSLWGLVVMARKTKEQACYILQTTRVLSLHGAATHFSLSLASTLGPTIQQQVEQAWLLQ